MNIVKANVVKNDWRSTKTLLQLLNMAKSKQKSIDWNLLQKLTTIFLSILILFLRQRRRRLPPAAPLEDRVPEPQDGEPDEEQKQVYQPRWKLK